MTRYVEPLIWTVALLLLYFMDISDQAISFCFFKLIGIEACFGCGIGHAIHYVLHGEIRQSFNEHILGLPATIGILYNIFKPFKTQKWINNKCL